MLKKFNKNITQLSLPLKFISSILLTTLLSSGITILITFIFSYFLSKADKMTEYTVIYLIFSTIIGGFVCGFVGTTVLKFKGIISGLICSVPYIITIFLMMFIYSDGKLNSYSFIMIIIVLISSCIGGITKANFKRRK